RDRDLGSGQLECQGAVGGLDGSGATVARLTHVGVDRAALQRGQGEFGGYCESRADGQHDHHDDTEHGKRDVHQATATLLGRRKCLAPATTTTATRGVSSGPVTVDRGDPVSRVLLVSSFNPAARTKCATPCVTKREVPREYRPPAHSADPCRRTESSTTSRTGSRSSAGNPIPRCETSPSSTSSRYDVSTPILTSSRSFPASRCRSNRWRVAVVSCSERSAHRRRNSASVRRRRDTSRRVPSQSGRCCGVSEIRLRITWTRPCSATTSAMCR